MDLILDAKDKKYLVQLKSSSEGRRDRLIPLLSQAILQAQACAKRFSEPATPIAVVAAKHIPASVADQIKQFAARYAPDVAVGVIDAEGFRSFVGPGLEGLDAKPTRRAAVASPQRLPDLFSDLNQWMLKILLGQRLPDKLISVPREPIRNASQLAKAANVSVMSASRLVNQLSNQGFLDRSEELIRIVRVDELLERWASATREVWLDIPARWRWKRGDERFQWFFAKVTEYHQAQRRSENDQAKNALPRCCGGLFAAADALGLGFVQGVPPHLYLERIDSEALERLELSIEAPILNPDVYIRIPSNKEAIFDAEVLTAEQPSPAEIIFDPKVSRAGLPVTDALQVWLDVWAYPARGREQADEIWRVLKRWFEKSR